MKRLLYIALCMGIGALYFLGAFYILEESLLLFIKVFKDHAYTALILLLIGYPMYAMGDMIVEFLKKKGFC